jgi:DNA-binding CsgD family transcriptional regulator
MLAVCPSSGGFVCLANPEDTLPLDVIQSTHGVISRIAFDHGLESTFALSSVRKKGPRLLAGAVSVDPWSSRERSLVPYLRKRFRTHRVDSILVVFFGDGDTVLGVGGLERNFAERGFSEADISHISAITPLASATVAAKRSLRELEHKLGTENSKADGISLESSTHLRTPQEASRRHEGGQNGLLGLSPREHEIAQRLGEGYTHVNISAIYGLSPHTVRTYIRRVYKKLNVVSRAGLIRELLSAGALT